MGIDMIPIMIKAARESNGKTIDLIVEKEIPGITLEMYGWWGKIMPDTRHYKMWHQDHISFELEKEPGPDGAIVAHPTEKLGKYGPNRVNFVVKAGGEYPFKRKYKNFSVVSHLSDEGLLLSLGGTEYEEGPNGLKIREIRRFPAKIPQDLIDAIDQHINEELLNFPKFLPELYKKEAKNNTVR